VVTLESDDKKAEEKAVKQKGLLRFQEVWQ